MTNAHISMENSPLIVTRHAATIEWLREQGIVGEVKTHVTAQDVKGRVVYGNLPLHLASEAKYICTVTLNVPEELRGQELDIEAVRKYASIEKYQVIKLEE